MTGISIAHTTSSAQLPKRGRLLLHELLPAIRSPTLCHIGTLLVPYGFV